MPFRFSYFIPFANLFRPSLLVQAMKGHMHIAKGIALRCKKR